MKTAEHLDPSFLQNDDLLRLQLQVARRADELAQSQAAAERGRADLNCWLEAENEVLGRLGHRTVV